MEKLLLSRSAPSSVGLSSAFATRSQSSRQTAFWIFCSHSVKKLLPLVSMGSRP